MALAAGLQVAEVGVKLVLSTGVDLTGRTALKVRARRPNGVERIFAGVVEGLATSGRVAYTFVAGDLDVAGVWAFFAQVEGPGTEVLKGETIKLRVKAEFAQ